MAEEEEIKQEVSENQEQDTNFLDMSDDDIARISPEELQKAMASQDTSDQEDSNEETNQEEAQEEEGSDEEPDDSTSEDEEEDTEEPVQSRKAVPAKESKEIEEEDEADTKADASESIDYKAKYEELLSPFKANGRMMKVETVEDARRLMQMGANYSKKMAMLKPNLRIVKTLEKNDLLDEEKINLLIDLHKKKPEAVTKFLKDAEIDPMDLNMHESTDYKPESHTISEKEMDLEEVLDEIRSTDTFERTIDELGNKWDARSRQVLSENPHIIRIINDHMAQGVYDQVMGIVEQQRLLGKLEGLTDIEAYKRVGDEIAEKGGFVKQQPKTATHSKPVQDKQVARRKRAASPTKGTATKKPDPEFNPLGMSDEDFEKVAASQYL